MNRTEVDTDEIRSTLEPSRELRLALEVLRGNLPPDMETAAIRESLWELHERICDAELTAQRIYGLNRQYIIIIRPLNMMKLPDFETMQKVTGAIQVLNGLGLIARPGDV